MKCPRCKVTSSCCSHTYKNRCTHCSYPAEDSRDFEQKFIDAENMIDWSANDEGGEWIE